MKALKNKIKQESVNLRFNILMVLVYIIGIILLVRLFNLQIVHGAEYRETSNTRLSREDYIERDNLRRLIAEAKAELEDIKKDAADIADATELEIKVYSKVYTKLKERQNPKTKQWLETLEKEQLEKEQDRQRRGALLLQQAQEWTEQQQQGVPEEDQIPE